MSAPALDECGYPEGVAHPHVEQCHRAERASVLAEQEAFVAAVEDVRRYAQMTLDSISVERQGMARDVLELLPEAMTRG